MSTPVLVALITAIPTLITAVVSVALNNRVIKNDIAHVKDNIGRIEKKVDKHNNFMERIAILERDDKTAFNRIDELRDDIHDLQRSHD